MSLLKNILKEDKYKDAVAYHVDFDNGREFKGAHHVRARTTLVVFKGDKEIGRSIGDLNEASVRKLLLKGL
ncbi:MAG: thioredoxin family protein [Nitrospinaceae bacterium]|nr:thioredoxin family protein [Nitrospinaceae bacterium]MBT3434022.1 thioredoxin family protein [Nitrospinaceae bacterium]MBT3823006.1 thioredoxin family protein [Nitrospinaceae bacterium]MBT4094611.1 thioredoxin family protein [Nitrospinaceae bacterium]MBT4428935.1 thioredoxin family protein [Nitrospinaceae bacterium]